MKGIFCKLSDSNTLRIANKHSVPEYIVKTIEQAIESEGHQDGFTTEQLVEKRVEQWLQAVNNPNRTESAEVPFYSGDITPQEDTIFVFGSNPEGIHGAGSARVAVNQFGAKYGQGEGIQGQAYALPTKRIEKRTAIKLPGYINYNFNDHQRPEILSSNTTEAIINGEITAITKYESDGNIEDWSKVKVGDIVELRSDKASVFVEVTKPLTKLDSKIEAEEWSKKEGWDTQYFNQEVKPKIEQAYQMEFKYAGANGERTVTPKEIIQNIKKLYAVASVNPTKQFKIGYRNKENDITRNGYSGREMMTMFLSAGVIPNNIVFSEEWANTNYFKAAYRVNQKLSGPFKSHNKDFPRLKQTFKADASGRGKLIYAQPGSGKTTVSDNINIIDGDFILSEVLNCPTSLVFDAWSLIPADEWSDYSKRYIQRIEQYVAAGKTVVASNTNILPYADYIVYRETAKEILEQTSKDRANAAISEANALRHTAAVTEEISKRNDKSTIKALKSDEYLGDFLLENPEYDRGSLQGQADRRSSELSLTKIIQDFLQEFGIDTEIGAEIIEELDVTALNRIVKANTVEDLPVAAGKQLALMSLYHEKMKPIVAEMIDRKNNAVKGSEKSMFMPNGKIKDISYKSTLAGKQWMEYCNYIGQYMGQVLREEYGNRKRKTSQNPSFIDKIIEVVKEIIAKLKQHAFFIDELDSTCRTFASHILANNPWYFKSSLKKPGSKTRAKLVDSKAVFDTYPTEASMIKEFEKNNIYLAGSLAIAFQGEVYRPDENPVHDLDFEAAFENQEELESALYSLDRFNKENLQLKTIIKDKENIKEGHATYTYIYLDRPYVLNVIDQQNGELLDPNTNETLAKYHKAELTILADNTYGKVLDFFVRGKDVKTVPVTLNDGTKLDITYWDGALKYKIDWVRLKDVYDYNRFVTQEFRQRAQQKQNEILQEFDVERLQAASSVVSYKKNRINPAVKQYRYKMVARDFVLKASTALNDEIYKLTNEVEDEESDTLKHKKLALLKKLKEDKGLLYYISNYPNAVADIFKQVKEEYQMFADTGEDMLDDEDILSVFPTSNPGAANYVRTQLSMLVDNFDSVAEGALVDIENILGIRLTLNPIVTVDGETLLGASVVEDENEENSIDIVNEDEPQSYSGGNTYKVRQVDNYKTLTNKVKTLISSVVLTLPDGRIAQDDLGNIQYLDPKNTHAILLDGLANMISSEDFCVKTTDTSGISFKYPALEKLSKKYSWVKQLIAKLDENPRLIGAFYGAYRKDFIPRYSYNTKDKIYPVNAKSVFTLSWRELNYRLDNGIPVNTYSIYNASGIDKSKITDAINYVNKVRDSLEGFNSTDGRTILAFANKIYNAYATVGLQVSVSSIRDILKSGDQTEIKTIDKALKDVLYILDKIESRQNENNSSMMGRDTKDRYKTVLQNLNIANDTYTEQTYRENGASHSSYTVPGYIETLFKKLKNYKGAQLEEFLNEEFRNIEGPFYRNGVWLNKMLADIANPRTRSEAQNSIYTCELSTINKKDYKNWTKEDILEGFLSMYLNDDHVDDKGNVIKANHVLYNAPIFSDSPVVKFIKARRYTSKFGDLFNEMVPLFRDVVKQELHRINHVEDRQKLIAQGKAKEVSNYDNVGQQFLYFTELNNMHEVVSQMKTLLANHNVTQLNALIDKNISEILRAEFTDWKNNLSTEAEERVKTILIDKGYSEDRLNEILEEYYLNQSFATSQFIQLLVTDPAYFEGPIEFQKRFKEVYAAGIKPNTQTTFGTKVQRAVYIADRRDISPVLSHIIEILDRAVKEGRILKMDRDNILHKFKNIAATDGQALRSLPSVKKLWDMLGKLEEVEDSLNRIKDGKWTMEDFYTIFQTIKPFVFSNIKKDDGLGNKMRVGHQQKDSEFILLLYSTIALDLNGKTEAKAIQEFMLANDIDVVVFESAVKTGGQGIIDIYDTNNLKELLQNKKVTIGNKVYKFPDLNDREGLLDYLFEQQLSGKYSQQDVSNIIDYITPTYQEVYNKLDQTIKETDADGNPIYDENGNIIWDNNYIHETPYEDYCITMSTEKDHLTDSETIYGSQFNTLISSDITEDIEIILKGKTLRGKDIKQLYHDLRIANLSESFDEVRQLFESPELLVKEILSKVDSNAKYNKGIKNAVKLVTRKDPNTGNNITTFNFPTNTPAFEDQLQEIILSIVKNKITKQKIKGGTAFLTSDIGYTKQLQIQYTTDKNGNKVIDYVPCFLPCVYKEMFKDLLIEKTEGNVTYYELNINKKDEFGEYVLDRDLLDMIGYRIPTEHKYSMVPLRVVGFLPKQNGSSIMLPADDVIVLSGADFDIDKLFLMMHEYYVDRYNLHKAKHDFKKLGRQEKEFDAWYKKNKETYRRATPIYRKVKYNFNNSPEENTREQRNNMLIDLSLAVLKNHINTEAMHKPQGFDSFIRGSLLVELLDNPEFTDVYSTEEIVDMLSKASIAQLKDLKKQYKKVLPILSPGNFTYFHAQNTAGGNALGAFANNTTRSAKYQGTGLTNKTYFIFNNIPIQALDKVYTTKKDPVSGQTAKVLITQNCCEGVGACADNAKQPTISNTRQYGGAVRLSGYLLSAGLSADDIALLFDQPVIRDMLDSQHSLIGIKEKYLDLYKEEIKHVAGFNWDAIDCSKYNFTTELFIRQAARSRKLATLSKEELENYHKWNFVVGKLMSELWEAATALGEITKVSKCDSINGAIGHNTAIASTQVYAVDSVHKKGNKDFYPLTGLQGVPINLGEETLTMSKEDLKAAFKRRGNPMLQAYYTFGIEMPVHILKTYFASLSDSFQEAVVKIHQDSPIGELSDKYVKDFSKKYTIYRLGTLPLFRKHGNFFESRTYYLREFPKKFFSILRENKDDIGQLEILKRIVSKGRGNRQQLIIPDSNLITEIEADRLRDSLEDLLYLNNPAAAELAEELFAYSFYAHSLEFLPHSFSRFFNETFQEAMPGYKAALRQAEEEMRRGEYLESFTEYWRNNHLKNDTLLSIRKAQQEESVEYGTTYTTNQSRDVYGEWRQYIKYKPSGVGSELATWKLLRLLHGNKKEATYIEIPSDASISFYNPDISIAESIELVRKQKEEDAKNQELEKKQNAWIAGVDDDYLAYEAEMQSGDFAGIDSLVEGVGSGEEQVIQSQSFERLDSLDDWLNNMGGQTNTQESAVFVPSFDTTLTEANISALEASFEKDKTDEFC